MPGTPCINISHLDKKRLKLHCTLCRINKGACVQCCYGRCVTAAHPWCTLKNPQGCTKRVIVDPEGNTQWETFCKVHASAVSEPFKPKAKAKQQVPIEMDEPTPAPVFSFASTGASARKEKSAVSTFNPSQPTIGGRALSMAHAKNFLASRLLAVTSSGKESRPVLPSRASFAASDDAAPEPSSDDDDSDAGVAASRRKGKTVGKKGTKAPASSARGAAASGTLLGAAAAGAAGAASRSFPILNMLEWPGISEGEPMDLDHFWNVISGHYPEDHTKEVRCVEVDSVHSCLLVQAVTLVQSSVTNICGEWLRFIDRIIMLAPIFSGWTSCCWASKNPWCRRWCRTSSPTPQSQPHRQQPALSQQQVAAPLAVVGARRHPIANLCRSSVVETPLRRP
jgi:hypothetical protein